MKLGICRDPKDCQAVEIMAKIGYDYVETNFSALSRVTEEEYASLLQVLKSTGLKCEASNCFLPGEIKVVGEEVDYGVVDEYLSSTFERAQGVGLQTAVFGSGGSRRVPDGFPREKAYEQLVRFLADYAGPRAKERGIQIAIEPLRRKETNIINTVKEGMELAKASGCDNVKGLADIFHVYSDCDDINALGSYKGMLLHTHISHPVTRRFPASEEEYDYQWFFELLGQAGCPRCSIEGGCDDFAAEAEIAYAVLRKASE